MITDEEKKAIERIEDTFYSDLGKGIAKFQKITLYEDSITDIRTILNLITKLQEENKKKDKVIDDLIAEIIRIIYYYENYKNCDFKYEITESISKTQENIKQYFYGKVENNE